MHAHVVHIAAAIHASIYPSIHASTHSSIHRSIHHPCIHTSIHTSCSHAPHTSARTYLFHLLSGFGECTCEMTLFTWDRTEQHRGDHVETCMCMRITQTCDAHRTSLGHPSLHVRLRVLPPRASESVPCMSLLTFHTVFQIRYSDDICDWEGRQQ